MGDKGKWRRRRRRRGTQLSKGIRKARDNSAMVLTSRSSFSSICWMFRDTLRMELNV
ncbi:hypothetical protein DITRI_Ditri18aG0051000 [Diplodiscus trichospermus]